MAEDAGGDRGEERYREALERYELADVRPPCRELLRQLRDADQVGYERAVRRYESELVPEVAEGDSDPVVAWLRYGAWLADQLRPGRAVAVDPGGKARPLSELTGDGGASSGSGPDAEGASFPARHFVVHVPEEWKEGGRIIAVPREPTEFQDATRELLGS